MLGNITIGDDAKIGAGALLLKEVLPKTLLQLETLLDLLEGRTRRDNGYELY